MFKNVLALVLSSVALFGADLGVLFNSTNNNTVSPDNLVIATFVISTNLELKYVTPARALSVDSNSNIVSSTLTSTQQGYLAALTGGTNLINLGSAKLIGAQGNPTNGVMSTNRTLYINTASTNVNDSLWINSGTNWFKVASTNGGSINESQLNFSDITTANSSTLFHGLFPKLSGVANQFINGNGLWVPVPTISGGSSANNNIPFFIGFPNSTFSGDNGFKYDPTTGTLSVTNVTAQGTGPVWNLGGTLGLGLVEVDDIEINNIADTTTGNVTTGHHGFAPKADGNSAHFLNGLGGWSSPAGGGAGSIASTGSPLDTYVTRWTGTNTITGTSEFTYDRQTLTIPTISPTNYRVVTNSTTSQITSGTYTPVRTPEYNCTTAGTTSRIQHYIRVGDQVTVTGRLQMARITTGISTFRVSLPIVPSNRSIMELTGSGTVTDSVQSFEVGSVVIGTSETDIEAEFRMLGSSTSGTIREFFYSFVYTTD